MDVIFSIGSQHFVWDGTKASSNLRKHGVPFERAAEVLLDPLAYFEDATEGDEARQAAIGFTRAREMLFVVHIILEWDVARIISARVATSQERDKYENNARAFKDENAEKSSDDDNQYSFAGGRDR